MSKSKRKRLLEKIFNKLEDKAILNSHKGPLIRTTPRGITRKDRRHSGRVTPLIPKPMMKWEEIKDKALLPEDNWDDWRDYRDGYREGYYLKKKYNYKLKKQIAIRKARKSKI